MSLKTTALVLLPEFDAAAPDVVSLVAGDGRQQKGKYDRFDEHHHYVERFEKERPPEVFGVRHHAGRYGYQITSNDADKGGDSATSMGITTNAAMTWGMIR